jgi:hypothetical protein
METAMDPQLNGRTPDRHAGRDDDLDRPGPSPLLRIVSIIVIFAMVLASASVIISLTDLGPRTGLVIFAVAIGIAGLLVWLWNRQGRTADDDIMDTGL